METLRLETLSEHFFLLRFLHGKLNSEIMSETPICFNSLNRLQCLRRQETRCDVGEPRLILNLSSPPPALRSAARFVFLAASQSSRAPPRAPAAARLVPNLCWKPKDTRQQAEHEEVFDEVQQDGENKKLFPLI